jgi:effector-binding domain-containing protein
MIYSRLITVVALLLFAHTVAMAIEEPSYEVIQAYEDFEVRRYQPYLVAEVDVSGGMDEAGNTAFRILAGYIFGDNQAATKMAMTAPVESRSADRGQKMAMTAPVTSTTTATEAQSTFAFVMERKYSMETLPVPNDQRIRIREVPERTLAVRRYSGRWTDANYEKNYQLLIGALSNANLKPVGEPVLARYNSPFTLPLMRRNEVMLEIEDLPSQHSERVARSYAN